MAVIEQGRTTSKAAVRDLVYVAEHAESAVRAECMPLTTCVHFERAAARSLLKCSKGITRLQQKGSALTLDGIAWSNGDHGIMCSKS